MSGTLQKANRPRFLSKRSIVYILQVPGTYRECNRGITLLLRQYVQRLEEFHLGGLGSKTNTATSKGKFWESFSKRVSSQRGKSTEWFFPMQQEMNNNRKLNGNPRQATESLQISHFTIRNTNPGLQPATGFTNFSILP